MGDENIDQREKEELDIVDIDGELLKLRDMLLFLKNANFVQSYSLEGNGINSHRFKKDEVDEYLVRDPIMIKITKRNVSTQKTRYTSTLEPYHCIYE